MDVFIKPWSMTFNPPIRLPRKSLLRHPIVLSLCPNNLNDISHFVVSSSGNCLLGRLINLNVIAAIAQRLYSIYTNRYM